MTRRVPSDTVRLGPQSVPSQRTSPTGPALKFARDRLVADVSPERLLMFDNEREEQEYVIGTRGLRITTLDEMD